MNGPMRVQPGKDVAPWLRPRPAFWFEMLTAREDLTVAVETLARTGRVELEAPAGDLETLRLPDLQSRLEDYRRMAQRYGPYWPERAEYRASDPPGPPARSLEKAMDNLSRWRDVALPLVRRRERVGSERGTLDLLQELLDAMGDSPLRLSLFKRQGGTIETRLFVLPADARLPAARDDCLIRPIHGRTHRFLVVIGPPTMLAELRREIAGRKGRPVRIHECLKATVQGSKESLRRRRETITQDERHVDSALHRLAAEHDLFRALGDIERLQWFLQNVAGLPVTDNFAWVTGWTEEVDAGLFDDALARTGVRALFRLGEPPAGAEAPMVLHNPVWARPFELFIRLFGLPGSGEADPSRLLAVVVPLLFGYMFGDVGQGLLLIGAGLALRRRWPAAGILVPAGSAALAFGFLYGTFFSLHGIVPALWLHPIDEPVTLLAVPLAAGAVLLLVGLALNALEALWLGEGRRWVVHDAGMVLLYVGVIVTVFQPAAAWAIPAGVLWYVAGAAIWKGGASAAGPATGELAEQSLRLFVNTLSFARVGAFALAHSGLSAAVVTLAESTGQPLGYGAVFVLGNAIIILLEGLVVSIQLTRLILFEFFIRFLRGEGRVFRPLLAPPVPDNRRQRSPG